MEVLYSINPVHLDKCAMNNNMTSRLKMKTMHTKKHLLPLQHVYRDIRQLVPLEVPVGAHLPSQIDCHRLSLHHLGPLINLMLILSMNLSLSPSLVCQTLIPCL